MNRATTILHAAANRPPVNILPHVMHTLLGGASLVSLNQRPLTQLLYTKGSSLDLYIQTLREFRRSPLVVEHVMPDWLMS